MTNTDSSTSANWYWSQRGTSMGPVDFAELRRLVAAGSITATTWIHHPLQGAWVQASTIAELMDAAPRAATSAPPDAPPPSVVFCRFCGASSAPTASHCSTCGRSMVPPANLGLDAKTATIICRASVLSSTVMPFLSILGPIIVWAVAPRDNEIVREAKACLNCHITMLIVAFAAVVIAFIGAIVIIGPFIGSLIGAALWIYALVVGILGLVAASDNRPFAYPGVLPLFR